MPFQLTIEEARELHSLALVLENEGKLHERFTRGFENHGAARRTIRDHAPRAEAPIISSRPTGPVYGRADAGKYLYFRELLRVHLNRCWGTSQEAGRGLSSYIHEEAKTLVLPEVDPDGPDAENYFVKVRGKAQTLSEARAEIHDNLAKANELLEKVEEDFNQARINTMTKNADIIVISTKTLVNDVDVSTLTDSEVYSLIAAQEAKIAELEAIKNKPKKLVAEIEKRQAGIAALVAHLDAKV